MVSFLQIMIYLMCVYLCFKGVEIFQIAYTSTADTRKKGMLLGVVMVACAGAVSALAVGVTEYMVYKMAEGLNNLPNFRP